VRDREARDDEDDEPRDVGPEAPLLDLPAHTTAP
jgi:hypothetical protein